MSLLLNAVPRIHKAALRILACQFVFSFFSLSILIPALHASLLSVTRLKEGKKDSKEAEECAESTGQAKKDCSCKEVRSFGMSDIRVGFDRKYVMECSGHYEAVGREPT